MLWFRYGTVCTAIANEDQINEIMYYSRKNGTEYIIYGAQGCNEAKEGVHGNSRNFFLKGRRQSHGMMDPWNTEPWDNAMEDLRRITKQNQGRKNVRDMNIHSIEFYGNKMLHNF